MLDRVATFLVGFILVLSSLAVLLSSQTLESYREDIKHNYDYCHASKDAPEHQGFKDCQSFLYKATDDPVALFTGGLFAFTVALAIATVRLFQVTKAGIAEQAELTRAAVDHAEKSANASKASADVARDTLISSHRAWIKIVGAKIVWPMRFDNQQGPCVVVQLRLTNVGSDIALNLCCKMWLMIEDDRTNNKLSDIYDSQVDFWINQGIFWNFHLYPGDTMEVDPNISICTHAWMPKDDWTDTKKSNAVSANMYVGGIISYKFPADQNIHYVTFRYSIDYQGQTMTPLQDIVSETELALGDRFWNGRLPTQIID